MYRNIMCNTMKVVCNITLVYITCYITKLYNMFHRIYSKLCALKSGNITMFVICRLLSLFVALRTHGIKFCSNIIVQAFCSILRSRTRINLCSFSWTCTSSCGFRGGLGSLPLFLVLVLLHSKLVLFVFRIFTGKFRIFHQRTLPVPHHYIIKFNFTIRIVETRTRIVISLPSPDRCDDVLGVNCELKLFLHCFW